MTEYSGFSKTLPESVIQEAQSGNEESLETIYRFYAPACFKLACRMLGESDLAEDIVNNAFVSVIQNIGHFEHTGSFAGWVRQITVNETLKQLQKLKLQDEEFNNDELIPELDSSDRFDYAWFETCEDLSKLTENMNPKLRAVLYLHEIEGFSHKEIALMFNKTESFSKQSLSRAFKYMATKLDKLGIQHAS